MKVSQEGIEWVKGQPALVEAIKQWLHQTGSLFECPMSYIKPGMGCGEEVLCNKIWLDLKGDCPCVYGKKAVIQIAKQIVGEETTDVRKISTE